MFFPYLFECDLFVFGSLVAETWKGAVAVIVPGEDHAKTVGKPRTAGGHKGCALVLCFRAQHSIVDGRQEVRFIEN
jgi:hypothetical protein